MPGPFSRLGPYRLLAPLGSGGMGQVFLAELDREEGFRKRLAVKCMRPELAREPAFREQFAREARLAAALNHPHVVQMLDYGRDGERAYLAMELVDGLDLARLLAARRGLPQGFVLAVGLGCLRALTYAHAQEPPVVHGDLGPGNILLGRQGEVKLGDFGLARLAGPQPGAGGVRGKPAYLAPEVALGGLPGPASDQFGLGAVLYELLSGRPPWAPPGPASEGAGPEACLARARRVELTPVSQAAPDAHPGLAAIVQRALAARPEDRWPSASDMLEALERLSASLGQEAGPRAVAEALAGLPSATRGEPDEPCPASPAGRTQVAAPGRALGPRDKKTRLAWVTGGGLALLAAGLLAWPSLHSPPARESPPRAPRTASEAPTRGALSHSARSAGRLGILVLRRPLEGDAQAASPAPSKRSPSSRMEGRPGDDAAFAAVDPIARPTAPVAPRPDPPPGVAPVGMKVRCAGLLGWRLDAAAEQPGPLETLRLGPGVHALRLRSPGLEALVRLEVPAAPGRIARLALRAKPEAVVSLDGRPRGLSPLGGLELSSGPHRLELAVRGVPPLTLELEFELPVDPAQGLAQPPGP